MCNGKKKWRSIILSSWPWLEHIELLGSNLPCESNTINSFWVDVFSAYSEFSNHVPIISSNELLSERIFYNSNILIGKKPFWYKNWLAKIYSIGHLVNDNGRFLLYNAFIQKYNINSNFLTFSSCISAVTKYIPKLNLWLTNNVFLSSSKTWTVIHSVNKGVRIYYETFVVNKKQPSYCSKWQEKFRVDIHWEKVFNKLCKIKDIKLKWFQIRVLNRIIATNITLHSMKVVTSSNCNFCKNERESILHLF